jgi:hypothetical protein
MAAAIARIYGRDLRSERVRTLIVATLVGDSIAEIATASGIRVGSGVAKAVADRVSRRGFIEFSRRVGSRLLRMAGQKSSVNLMKGVPLIGGIAGGTLDAVGCRIVGKHARKLFETPDESSARKKAAPGRAKSPRKRAATAKPGAKRPANRPTAKKSSGTKPAAAKGKVSKKAAPPRKAAAPSKPPAKAGSARRRKTD